jgi:hypothetical protein
MVVGDEQWQGSRVEMDSSKAVCKRSQCSEYRKSISNYTHTHTHTYLFIYTHAAIYIYMYVCSKLYHQSPGENIFEFFIYYTKYV